MDLDDLFKHAGGHGKHPRRHDDDGHHDHERDHRHDHRHDDHDDDHDDDQRRRLLHDRHQRDDGPGGGHRARRHGHMDRRDEWQARGHGPFGSVWAILPLLARHKWGVAAAVAVALVLLALATWLLVTLLVQVAPTAVTGLLGQLRSILSVVVEAAGSP